MTKKSVAKKVETIKKAAKAGKIVFPAHGTLPAQKPKGPVEITHVSMVGFNGRTSDKGGFVIQWGTKEHGFGEFTFVQRSTGTITCDSEGMSRNTVRLVLDKFFDKMEILE